MVYKQGISKVVIITIVGVILVSLAVFFSFQYIAPDDSMPSDESENIPAQYDSDEIPFEDDGVLPPFTEDETNQEQSQEDEDLPPFDTNPEDRPF